MFKVAERSNTQQELSAILYRFLEAARHIAEGFDDLKGGRKSTSLLKSSSYRAVAQYR